MTDFLKRVLTGETKETKETKVEEEEEDEEKQPQEAPLYLTEHFGALVSSDRFSDCVFVVGSAKKRIPAHRLVLAASSPVFEAMLYPNADFPDMKPHAGPIEVSLPDTNVTAFINVLRCIYTDKLEISASNVSDMVNMGKKYQIDKLQVICADFLESDVSVDNVLDLFEIAPTLLDDKDFGLKFIEENAEEIFETDRFVKLSKSRLMHLLADDELGIDEFPLWEAVLRWGKAECKRLEKKSDSGNDLKDALKDIMPLVRFPTMEMDIVAAQVATSGLLTQDLLLDLFRILAMTDEKQRAAATSVFNTKPRAGGFVTRESKILVRKHKKDLLKYFGVGTGPGTTPGAKKPKFTLLYRGSRDGFTAQAFHGKCDGKGPTLTVIKAANQKNIFGGYVQDPWTGSGSYSSNKAWLFSLENSRNKSVRLDSNSPSNNCYMNSGYGPTWGGGHDLHVSSNMKSNSSYCNPSTYRNLSPGYDSVTVDNTLLAGSYNFTVEEIEVFLVKTP